MPEEPIDISRDRETGEIKQFTIIDKHGQPQLIKASPENILLYDPEGKLPFDGGMYEFLQGNQAIVLNEDDPKIMVAPTDNEYCYIVRVRNRTVETTPSQAKRALEAIKAATIDKDITEIVQLHDDIVSNQVRRDIVNKLMTTFEETARLKKTGRGWLVDDFYLVNWEASMYTKHNDPNEGDYKRGGGGVTKTDTLYEFVQLSVNREIEPIEITVAGSTVRLSEREMLFLGKIKWLLNRREMHPDIPFWQFSDKYASVDNITGEPETTDEDSSDERDTPDGFNL